jgi:hypothetical protein
LTDIVAQVKVRLVEAIEQDETVDTSACQVVGHVPDRAEMGDSFSATGIFTVRFTMPHDFDVMRLDVLAAHGRIGRDEMDVELERRRAGLFELAE